MSPRLASPTTPVILSHWHLGKDDISPYPLSPHLTPQRVCSPWLLSSVSAHRISEKCQVPRDPHFLHDSLLFAESRSQKTVPGDYAVDQKVSCGPIPGSQNLLCRKSPQVKAIRSQETDRGSAYLLWPMIGASSLATSQQAHLLAAGLFPHLSRFPLISSVFSFPPYMSP